MELADPKQISQLMERYNSREPRLRQSNPRMTQKHASLGSAGALLPT